MVKAADTGDKESCTLSVLAFAANVWSHGTESPMTVPMAAPERTSVTK